MKILLIGKNGQVGWELQRALAPLGELVAVGRSEMNLANPDSIRNVLRDAKPNLIVNAAAYTSVDKAESEPDLAMQVNGIAPGILAEEARRIGAAMVHYSTDYVFDGTKSSPYTEEDEPNPINVYGKTKLAGDIAVQGSGIPYLILRTSWVYGTRGHNFLLTMLRLAKENKRIRVVDDQIGAPTWSVNISNGTMKCLQKWTSTALTPELGGIYNLSASGCACWFQFAGCVIGKAQFDGRIQSVAEIVPISSAEYAARALRPKNSVLSNEKLWRSLGVRLPEWKSSLLQVLEILGREPWLATSQT